MKYFSIIFLLHFVCSSAIGQASFDHKLTPDQLKEDLDLFQNTLTAIHPNLYLYTPRSSMDSLFEVLGRRIENSMSTVDFFRAATPIVQAIRNAHTIIKPPQAFLDYINSDAPRLPMSFIYNDDRLQVLKNYSDNKSIRSGDEITAINGIPIRLVMDSLSHFTFVDGYNMAYSDYLSSRFMSKRYAYYIGTPLEYDLNIVDNKGISKEVKIMAKSVKEFYTPAPVPEDHPNYTFKIKGDKAILSINNFSFGNVRKFSSFTSKLFKEIKDKEIKNLIIDFRNNAGGNPDATNTLLGYLIFKEINPIKEKFALVDELPTPEHFTKDDAFKYFHKAKMIKQGQLFIEKETDITIKPCKNNYSGNLIFLINEVCASATTSLLGQIKTHRPDATIIGTPALGNPAIVVASYMVSLVLPNSKIIIKIPLVSSEKNVNFDNPKSGVQPDMLISSSVDDILTKKDIVMEKAFELIAQNK